MSNTLFTDSDLKSDVFYVDIIIMVNAFSNITSNQALIKVGRALSGIAPFVGAVTAGVALYHISPDFREGADALRAHLNMYPRTSEMLTSGLTIGFLPDFMAQRYEGRKFSFFRSTAMTLLGAVTGGVFLREFYSLQNHLFPGSGFMQTAKKILVDQFNYTPLYLAFYLTYTNLIQNKPWDNFLSTLRKNMVKTLPVNWVYWGTSMTVVYNLPPDLMVYSVNLLSLIWFTFLSKMAYQKDTTA